MTEATRSYGGPTAGESEQERAYDELASMHQAVVADLERYRALFDASPTALFVTDGSLRVLEANMAAAKLFGVDLRFVIGKPLVAYVSSEYRREFRTWATRLLRGEAPRSAHIRLRRRTGVAFEAQVTVTMGHGELYWTISDRTDEALAEARLWELNRELEERVAAESAALEAMVDQLPVGVAVLDAAGEVIWTNNLASRLIGAQSSAPSPLVVEAGHALRGGIVRDVRVTVDGTDGSPRVIELTAAHVARHGGAALIFTDVTERERVAKAETEFVENAAHQLRNPIAAISGSVAALEAGAENDDAERAKFISHIARESNRLAALVEALLTLAGLERGGGATLIELVPLRPLLDEVVASTELHDGVRVVVDCTDPIAVVGDRDLFVEAIGNVVTNAAQHTERGEIRIAATLDGKTVVLDVTDGGPGVPDELRDRLFDRFVRMSANGRRGSGLGLAIARAATQAADSHLELLPRDGNEGATFRFTMPGARLL